jgi:hypothetical protein
LDKTTITFWITVSFFFYLLTILAIIDVIRKDFGTIGKKARSGELLPFSRLLVGWFIWFLVSEKARSLEKKHKKSV